MALDIIIPSPGESISEVTISSWLVSEGDYVEMDQPLVEMESEKATFEINAEAAGAVVKMIGEEGDDVEVGAIIASIDTDAVAPEKPAEAAPSEVKSEEGPVKKEPVKEEKPVEKPVVTAQDDVLISPVAKKLLEQAGMTTNGIQGSGANGRITKVDALEAIVGAGKSIGSGGGFRATGSRTEKREKMSKLRKTISKRLVMAKNETAMLTTFNEVDMKPIMDIRAKYKKNFADKHEIGLGFMSFFTRACAIALQDWPAVNAFIDGEEMVYNDFCDVSIAVSGPKGLVVPVIRDAQTLSMWDIEKEVKRLALKARENKLSIDEMTGGTFTITNGGIFGSMLSTPIINPPQSAILGMHNIVERPVVVSGEVVVRPIMYVALSYDHRIIDGRESVGFLYQVKELLENPERLLSGKDPVTDLLGF
jgi:2-oxoglutarate dehydrogenase E2 component (dihydrolipoamide succinyltransferase)